MRISSFKPDPGYVPGLRGVKVYLDGRWIKDAVTADDELGEVVRLVRDAAGRPVITAGRKVVHETLRGRVRIEVPAAIAPALTQFLQRRAAAPGITTH